jgi:hypothetical protein
MKGRARSYDDWRNQNADNDNSKRQRLDGPAEYIVTNRGGTNEATRKINYIIDNGDTCRLTLR